ncbi:hypothetical protein Gpo141_00007439 [Globisporangium polare]
MSPQQPQHHHLSSSSRDALPTPTITCRTGSRSSAPAVAAASADVDMVEVHCVSAAMELSALKQSPTKKKATSSLSKKKRVSWSTITVHEFGVGLGGSAVPSKGGASIGLADAPEFTWVTKVGEMAERSEGIHRFSPDQRKALLQKAGVEDVMIERYARETSIILGSRRRTVLEDLADERKEKSRKRNAEQALLERPRPCSVYSRRPRMIPANYV